MGLRRAIYAAGLATALAAGPPVPDAHASSSPRVDSATTRVAGQVTGPLNATDARWNVSGTDLGSMFEWRGRIYMTFGDTFGRPQVSDLQDVPRRRHPRPDQYADWRSNTMAYFADADPELGPRLDGMIVDPARPLRAKELLSSAKQDCTGATTFCEQTVIPNDGFAIGDRMYLHYMSVRRFDYPHLGDYDTNYSGVAWSGDGGRTWTKDPAAVWPAPSSFGIVATTRVAGHVYLLGIPASRRGSVKLARVRDDGVLRRSAYRYWDGTRWNADQRAAAVVADGPVGELSVQWSSYFGKWLMMYLRIDPSTQDSSNDQIVLRTADCLTGPWSDPQPVVRSDRYPSIYAPMIPPRWNDGPRLFFAMSIFDAYNVYWMRTSLTGTPRPGLAPRVRCSG